MAVIKVLLVNYDANALELYGSLLAGHNIQAHTAETMPEALDMLLEGGYAGIVINADDFEYLPFLKVMRALTAMPIGVSTSYYDEDENETAVKNGATRYRVRHDPAKYRVKNFSDMIKIYLAFDPEKQKPMPTITCGEIRLDLETRRAFVKDREIHLKKTGFDILCYLVINKGLVLSHEQIFRNVWGDSYEDSSIETLRNHIGDIRRELKIAVPRPGYIKTVRGVGYAIEE